MLDCESFQNHWRRVLRRELRVLGESEQLLYFVLLPERFLAENFTLDIRTETRLLIPE